MAETVVMKFGGTSVGSIERIAAVAKRVAERIRKRGDSVVVVVSAMSGETDRLIKLSREVFGQRPPSREYHQLLASGEQVSAALTAMALAREGLESESLLAHQIQLRTHRVYGQNLITGLDGGMLRDLLERKVVPVVAGFQGVDENGGFTTLGRGGSDTTGVALSAALGACRCEILTDVDGVYTALPSVVKKARKLKALNYEEMLELASSGAKVLQARSVALAHKHKVPVIVCSSFSDTEGTEIVESYHGMEDAVVSGITFRTDEAKITLRDLPDAPGVASKIFGAVADAGVVVDMIVQSEGLAGKAAISFTLPEESLGVCEETLQRLVRDALQGASLEVDRDIAKLSVVGEGMRTHAGVAAQMFEVLGKEGINIDMITTSEIKISVAIEQKYAELAMRVLHEYFIESR